MYIYHRRLVDMLVYISASWQMWSLRPRGFDLAYRLDSADSSGELITHLFLLAASSDLKAILAISMKHVASSTALHCQLF